MGVRSDQRRRQCLSNSGLDGARDNATFIEWSDTGSFPWQRIEKESLSLRCIPLLLCPVFFRLVLFFSMVVFKGLSEIVLHMLVLSEKMTMFFINVIVLIHVCLIMWYARMIEFFIRFSKNFFKFLTKYGFKYKNINKRLKIAAVSLPKNPSPVIEETEDSGGTLCEVKLSKVTSRITIWINVDENRILIYSYIMKRLRKGIQTAWMNHKWWNR